MILALIAPRAFLVWNAFTSPERSLLTDSAGYLELAGTLREEGRFHASEHEESLRTPGYPAFLAVVQLALGEKPGFVILVQVLLTLATAWLIYRSGSRMGGRAVGRIAVWLYALSPNALFWAGTIMTETFFAFWLALALALLAESIERGRWVACGAGGLALGVAVLVRPIGLYLIPIWALGALAAGWKRLAGLRRWQPAGALLLAALAPVLAWQTRNLLVHDSFRLTASFSTVFIDYTAASTLGEAEGLTRDAAAAQLRSAPDPFAAAVETVRTYPAALVRVSLQGIARTALGTEAGTWVGILAGADYAQSGMLESLLRGDVDGIVEAIRVRFQESEGRLGSLLLLWGLLYSAAVLILALLGLVRLKWVEPTSWRWIYAAVLLTVGYLILLPLTIGDARFRVPVEPLLALLGALAFARSARGPGLPPEARVVP